MKYEVVLLCYIIIMEQMLTTATRCLVAITHTKHNINNRPASPYSGTKEARHQTDTVTLIDWLIQKSAFLVSKVM